MTDPLCRCCVARGVQGSAEWEFPAAAPRLAELEEAMEDEATFFMPFDAFVAFFNRLHVCRLFPPTWHQLTLHCGWQVRARGGCAASHSRRCGHASTSRQKCSHTPCLC